MRILVSGLGGAMGREVARLALAGCRGAATLAAKAVEGIEIPVPRIVSEVEPDPRRAQLYHRKFEKWKIFSREIRSLSKWLS